MEKSASHEQQQSYELVRCRQCDNWLNTESVYCIHCGSQEHTQTAATVSGWRIAVESAKFLGALLVILAFFYTLSQLPNLLPMLL